jgi:hypothetical protein
LSFLFPSPHAKNVLRLTVWAPADPDIAMVSEPSPIATV